MKKKKKFSIIVMGNLSLILMALLITLLCYVDIVTSYIIFVTFYELIICPLNYLMDYILETFKFAFVYIIPFYFLLCLFPVPYHGAKSFKFFGVNIYKLYYNIIRSKLYIYLSTYFNLYSNFIFISSNLLLLFMLLYFYVFDKIFLFLFFLIFYIIFVISIKLKHSRIKILEYKKFNICLNFLLVIVVGFYISLIMDIMNPILSIRNIDIYNFF